MGISIPTFKGSTESHIFKNAGDLALGLDVYRGPDAGERSPALVWIHGGALINGGRTGLTHLPHEIEMYFREAITLISIDYRLAPETKVPAIVEDVRDAFAWVGEHTDMLRIDPERIGVVGHSAGGYLSLMAGTFAQPPKVVVSFYGYGDIVADWLAKPSTFYRKQPLVSETDAWEFFKGPPVADAGERPGQGPFYLYCRQQGIWPTQIGGVDPAEDPTFFEPYCPARNVTAEYPPTILLHGQQDTDVPYEQSVQMSEALAEADVEHELVLLEKGHHGFDYDPNAPGCEEAFGKLVSCP